jgi:diphosphomevalonate decarboxylase
MRQAVAIANSNVALAKYWGKRNESLNLPYTGSISITLAGLSTRARVRFGIERNHDRIVLNGEQAVNSPAYVIRQFLDHVRQAAGEKAAAELEIRSNFPVAAGLASSASTFAALALATTSALGLSLSPRELSALARRGSGSAARSIFGGYAEWLAGEADDGSDSYAVQLAAPEHWRLGVVVAITDLARKPVGSREGMAHALKKSPFFPAWLESHEADLAAVRQGILDRDLAVTGQAAERNCLKMHAASMAASPPLLYWKPATLAVMHRVLQLREEGTAAYFTIDAGPQVKIICPWPQRDTVAAAIREVPGVRSVLLSEPGGAAELVECA